MLHKDQLPISKRKSFRFNKILVAIASVHVLPITILGANVTTVTTFILKMSPKAIKLILSHSMQMSACSMTQVELSHIPACSLFSILNYKYLTGLQKKAVLEQESSFVNI